MKLRLKKKQGLLKYKKFYCEHCEQFTLCSDTPEGIKCDKCKKIQYMSSRCNHCGVFLEGEDYDIYCRLKECKSVEWCSECKYAQKTKVIYSNKSYLSTPEGSGYDWVERHTCPRCKTVNTWEDSSY